jgi:hypothetical protein
LGNDFLFFAALFGSSLSASSFSTFWGSAGGTVMVGSRFALLESMTSLLDVDIPLLVRRMVPETPLLIRLALEGLGSSSSRAVPSGSHMAGFRFFISATQASQSNWTQKSITSDHTLSEGFVKLTKTTLPPLL